jgi:molybdopterin/thiamine biosynthesis adenylyltransferase
MNHDRNIGIFTEEQQALLGQKSLVILGVGLGSNIAELAVRTGFKNLTIVDGDVVSESNLNRQAYVSSDIGNSKVSSVEKRLLEIEPSLFLKVIDRYLSPDDVEEVLAGVDIIVDTIDLSSIAVILSVHEFAKKHDIPVVFPMNLGWTSMATSFTRESMTLEEFMHNDKGMIDQASAKDFSFWAKFLGQYVPEYGREQYQAFLEKASKMDDWCPAPQLGMTVASTSSIVVAYCTKIALGLPYKTAPEMVSVDLFLQ